LTERSDFLHVLRASQDGSVAKPWGMLNTGIFDPWQRSLFSRQQTAGKEPLLAGRLNFSKISKIHEMVSGWAGAWGW